MPVLRHAQHLDFITALCNNAIDITPAVGISCCHLLLASGVADCTLVRERERVLSGRSELGFAAPLAFLLIGLRENLTIFEHPATFWG